MRYVPSSWTTICRKFRYGFNKGNEDECWIWLRGIYNSRGMAYGALSIKKYEQYVAHRVSYCYYNDLILKDIEDKVIMHTCDEPRCVNPKHLKLGTQADNIKDCIDKKRNAYGERQGQSKLIEEQVLEIRLKYRTMGYTLEDLGREYNTDFQNISKIINYKSWRHLS